MMTATHNTLPFDLTVNSLNSWLETLSELPHTQAAHQLNEVLKQIKAEKTDQATLLPLLFNLTPLTLHFANNLANSASTEAKFFDRALKVGKLSMQLPRQLALLFCLQTDNKTLETQTLSNIIYYALQLIGYSLRCYGLFYEVPSKTLWKKSADLYKLAAANECLNTSQTSKITEFKAQNTIASVIKRNLLFSTLTPNLYKADEISQIFQLANHAADLLITTTDHEMHNVGFYWDLDKDMPPYPVKKINRTLPDGFMAIDSQAVSNALQLGTLPTALGTGTQNKMALVLSSYHQVFSSIVPGLPSSSKIIHGFPGVCNYLNELNKLSKINQLSSPFDNAASTINNLSLVPLEHQRNVFETSSQAFKKPQNIGISVNILKTPSNRYIVAESRSLNCSTGDIALIHKEQHPLSLGIIRQQKYNEISRLHQFMLELIPGTCNIFNLANSTNDSAYAIVVGEGTSEQQVFLAYGKYTSNTKLPLSLGGSIHLKAYLENNTFFTRFRFNFTD